MTRTASNPFNMQTFGVALLALGFVAPATWSQEANEFNPDAPRAVRNDQGSIDDYDSGDAYVDQGNYQDDRFYDDRNIDQRGYQGDPRNRRDQFDDPTQGRQRDQQGNQRNRPAGLGVMLDTSQGTVEVRRVARNSPADRAGIRSGDEILAINGQRVNSTQQVAQLVRQEQPGAQVDIRIRRNGQQRTLTAQLESLQQALDTMERTRQQQRQQEQEFGQNSPPWGDDQLMQHVDALEQQVRRMQQEIEDLRSMLDSDPTQQRFSQRNQRGQSQFRD